MKTYGSHEDTPVRGKYPARCSICGVVWQARDLQRQRDGTFQCPDDRGATVSDLDEQRARRRSRGVVDTAGPRDPPVENT